MRNKLGLKPATDPPGVHLPVPFLPSPVAAPAEGGHNPQLCADPGCDRLACIAYKAGYRNGYRDGYGAGYGAGYAAGYSAGYAAGQAAAQ